MATTSWHAALLIVIAAVAVGAAFSQCDTASSDWIEECETAKDTFGLLTPNPDRHWADPDTNGRVTANDLSLLACLLNLEVESPTWTTTPVLTATLTTITITPTATVVVAPSSPTPTSSRTATGTATMTPSPVATSTATATAIPTGVPDSYSIADLLFDTEGPHDSDLCSSVDGFSWDDSGRVQDAVSDEHDQIASWGTVQWAECGVTNSNTVIELRNLRVEALVGNSWITYADQDNPFNWCNNTLANTATLKGDCTRVGNGYRMPTFDAQGNPLALHWAEGTDNVIGGYSCHVVIYEARKIGAGEIIANTGLDWREGDASRGDSWFGSYRRVTGEWEPFGGTSCTQQQLEAAGMP